MVSSARVKLDPGHPLAAGVLQANPSLALELERDPALWRFLSLEAYPTQPPPNRQCLLPKGAAVGRWTVRGLLGRGQQGGAVYHVVAEPTSSSECPEQAALKFPVLQDELHFLSAVQSVEGVPDLLDHGSMLGGTFVVMPILNASLDRILQRLDHDGLGGRMSWEAARGLGRRLVEVLRAVHARGVVHCDVKPANVMLDGAAGFVPQIVDFGRARSAQCPASRGVVGALEFNSVRAGRGSAALSPADDLESAGWLMLRCVVGHLPWRRRIADFKRSGVPRDVLGQLVASEKEQYLNSECEKQSWRYGYCPAELKQYFLHIHSLHGAEPDYSFLLKLLSGNSEWEWLVERVEKLGNSFWPVALAATRGLVIRRPHAFEEEPEERMEVPRFLRIRVTGQERHGREGHHWLEAERVWAPGLPRSLLNPCWLRAANEEGDLLLPVDLAEGLPPLREVSEDAEFWLMGSWDDWSHFVPLKPVRPGESRASAVVDVLGRGWVDFQVVQDRDLGRRFFPCADTGPCEVCGPAADEQAAWHVAVPPGCQTLRVSWDPCGARRIDWSF
mmetsp:Transcript_80047/g.226538  ORF Transcript_80047/g.226538 Transcript_80047/m.226538 type:complete len:559 (-) Transcript_80047:206-1882(-)